MVELQPSKLIAWVRFPSPAPMVDVFAHIAQSVEHFLGKEEVTGSIPVVSSRAKIVFAAVLAKIDGYFIFLLGESRCQKRNFQEICRTLTSVP